jgi:hypothetical protein
MGPPSMTWTLPWWDAPFQNELETSPEFYFAHLNSLHLVVRAENRRRVTLSLPIVIFMFCETSKQRS